MHDNPFVTTADTGAESILATSRVLRNTYALLASTLLFSALVAVAAISMNAPYLGPWFTLGGYFVLLFMTHKFENSSAGIFWVFALTGWLGFTIAPILSMVLGSVGPGPILTALGGTAIIFFGLSGYVLMSRKDLSFMGGFLVTGLLVAFVAGIANIFFNISGLSLAVSAMFLLLSSGVLAWQTSAIIHGGERNYIRATVTLFVSLYNIFMSLLHLIMAFGGDD